MHRNFKYLFIAIIFFLGKVVIAQPLQIKFEHISTNKGLSQSSISSIVQDEHGFMWFGTLDGLNRYDSYNFKKYYSSRDTNSIPSNIITDIINDHNNTLWVATDKGLCKYNKYKDNFIRIKDSKTKIQEKSIVEIKNEGNYLWIATKYKFFKLNITTHEIKEIKLPKELNNIKLKGMYLYNNHLWIVSEKIMCRLDQEKNSFKIIDLVDNNNNVKRPQALHVAKNKMVFFGTNKYFAKLIKTDTDTYKIKIIQDSLNITSITEDEHGILWLGTKSSGLLSYNTKTNRFIKYENDPSNRYCLSVNYITSLYYSKAGILWIGTNYGGINKWNRLIEDIHVFKTNPFRKNSLSSNMVRSIFLDSYDVSWIGTVDKGLNLWLIDKKRFTNYRKGALGKDASLNETTDGDLLDISKNEYKHFIHKPKDKTSIPNNHVRSIMETKQRNLWIGTDGGGIAKLNRKTWTFETLDTANSNLSSDNVWKIYQDSKDNIWIATNGGGLNLFNEETKTFKSFRYDPNNIHSISSDNLTTVFEDSKGNLWIGTLDNGLNKYNYSDNTFTRYAYNIEDTSSIPFERVYSIIEDSKNNLWLGLKGCLSNFDVETNTFHNYTTSDGLPNNVVMGILEDEKHNLWISTNNGICEFSKEKGVIRNYNVNDGLQSNEFLVGSFYQSKRKVMFFGGIGGLNAFQPSKLRTNENVPFVVINEFTIMNKVAGIDTVISENKEITIKWYEEVFSLGFVSIDYIASQENKYKIKLEGIDKDWVDYGNRRYVSYNNLPAGDYIFRVIGSNNDGVWNKKGASLIIHVLPPWWETTWFRIEFGLFVIFLIILWVKLRERKLKKEKRILEEKVKQRTQKIRGQKEEIELKSIELGNFLEEVETQKDEIENQKDEIESQKDMVLLQKNEIEEIHNEISASINYAKRLQDAILPDSNIKNKHLSGHFILFKPKDKVSGDFFWWAHLDDYVIITASDCTGHGVPGAFMSLLGISFLREIIIKEKITYPTTILNNVRNEIIKTLKQKGEIGEQKDGMDMALISINYKTNIIQFAGANNPLYIITDTELPNINENKSIKLINNNSLKIDSSKLLYEVKPDKMPIAIYDKMKDFTTHEIQLRKGDQVYMFSDGYADQFGGPRGRKLMYKPFKRLLIENAHKPMAEQKQILDDTFENWKGDLEQVDDVVIIGVTI